MPLPARAKNVCSGISRASSAISRPARASFCWMARRSGRPAPSRQTSAGTMPVRWGRGFVLGSTLIPGTLGRTNDLNDNITANEFTDFTSFDGIRAQAHVAPGRVALYSRDLKEVTGQFPEVAAALEALPGTLILDGELLAYRDGAALPFLDLQKRLGRKAPGAAALAAVPVSPLMKGLEALA